MYIYILSYPAYNAHVLYCRMWPVRLYHIFPHSVINGQIFGKNVMETRFRFSAKRTSPFKSARASVQSTTGSRGVRISGSNAGYAMFRGSVNRTGYPLRSPVSPSLPLPCVTVCHHISTGVYQYSRWKPAVSYCVRGQQLCCTYSSLTYLFLGVRAK